MSSEREVLLEKLYHHVWNEMRTFESGSPLYAYVPYDDLEAQDEICAAIEELDSREGS